MDPKSSQQDAAARNQRPILIESPPSPTRMLARLGPFSAPSIGSGWRLRKTCDAIHPMHPLLAQLIQATSAADSARTQVSRPLAHRSLNETLSAAMGPRRPIGASHVCKSSLQTARRLAWLRLSLDAGEFQEALRLAVTRAEVQMVRRAEMQMVRHPELLVGSTKQLWSEDEDAESQRERAFVVAIREYDWGTAGVLARTEEERADVESSCTRLKLICRYAQDGKVEEALSLAITQIEIRLIKAFDPQPALSQRGLTEVVTQTHSPVACAQTLPHAGRGNVGVHFKEQVRQAWLGHYVSAANWDEAFRLCATREEVERVRTCESVPLPKPSCIGFQLASPQAIAVAR